MSRHYFIHDALGQRRINEQALPLCIGGKNHAGVVLPDTPESQLSAYIALSNGHAYIQPADTLAETKQPEVFLNDEILTDSAWLKSGDIIQIGEAQLCWTVSGDKILIGLRLELENPTLQPPLNPPPGNSPLISDDMPVPASDPGAAKQNKRLRRLVLGVASLLVLAATFMLFATPVVIKIEPAAQQLNVEGFPPVVSLWGSYLALPGHYTIKAYRQGFKPLSEKVDISMNGTTELSYTLTELPGLLNISSRPNTDMHILVDGGAPEKDHAGWVKISRGKHQLRVETERYLLHEQSIEINGFGERQQLDITLVPAWAPVSISSEPAGAAVRIDGEFAGITPLLTEILRGPHAIELNLDGFKTITEQHAIEAGVELTLGPFIMQPEDGELQVHSHPQGASVTLDKVFRGTSPLQLKLSPNTPHELRLSLSGYNTVEQEIVLTPLEKKQLDITLEQKYGTVFISTNPADAKLLVDGRPPKTQSRRLRLSVRPHTLTISKPGYISRKLNITPRTGVSQNIEIKLSKNSLPGLPKQIVEPPATINTPKDQSLRLIQPNSKFSMGASRREAGRRANESRRLVQLKRPFYLASKEISNREFRQFRPSHNSGQLDGTDLNGELQPVVNVSWQDAARYCNWLSEQQGLPAAYENKNGKMLAIYPMTTGYRLPTEAEWAWTTRQQGQAKEQRYPWSGDYPPRTVNGNYADARIADTLADVVPGYDDGYRGTAAIGSFPAYPEGFFDLGGNVSEWMHDFYALYPGQAKQLVTDPSGPASGDHHVVRGASWRHGNITELRLSYRDYSQKPRYDLGFRIARYAK